jgi:hypothetical protein
MAREEYIPVAADDWYQRRRNDAEGKFFVSMANQGPRKGEGGDTRQGIYCLTADGKLLAYKNVGQNPQAMRDLLREGLSKWRKLPDSDRLPGAFHVPDHGPMDHSFFRSPPAGGLILNVYARALDRKQDERIWAFTDAVCKVGSGDEASRDHLWLTDAEWRSLLPANPRQGDKFPMPIGIAERVLRFHLVDNTRGEPPMWRREHIRRSELIWHIEDVRAETVRLRLEGSVLVATSKDLAQAERGYEATLLGYLTYNPISRDIRRFDLVSVGDHWGAGPYTRRARPGRTPLGIAFEMAGGESPADRVAPQGAREIRDYFGR